MKLQQILYPVLVVARTADKSVFIPSQRLVLLGFIFDSATMTIILTPENALKVKEACGTILGQGGSRGRVQGVRTPPPLR